MPVKTLNNVWNDSENTVKQQNTRDIDGHDGKNVDVVQMKTPGLSNVVWSGVVEGAR